MKPSTVLAVLFLLQVGAMSVGRATMPARPSGRTPLQIIALVPTENENRSIRCVDRGEELIVAANMAAEAIIANNTLLKNHSLQIITARSDNCTAKSFSVALSQFVRHVTDVSYNRTVGVVGMLCPSNMVRVSPFVSMDGISLLQITAGAMPPNAITRDRERVKIDHVYQTAPASTIYNDALIALMKRQGWGKIATVRLTGGLNIIHLNQGSDLQDKLANISNSSIVFNGEVIAGQSGAGFNDLLDEIQNRRARIIYATLPDMEARELLCQSYTMSISSPLYTWVLHDHTIENLKQAVGNCTEKMMAEALNGVILLHYNETNDKNRTLDYSNMTYSQYQDKYRSVLLNNSGDGMLCGKEPGIVHSNAMYDSIIALALALDKAQTMAMVDLTQYGRGMPNVTAIINDYLKAVEFNGAGGMISFDNVTHELKVKTGVNIHLIHDLNLLSFAFYDGKTDSINEQINYNTEIKDSFEEDIVRVHIALSITILAIVAILVTISIIILILYIYNCGAPDIKASSPILSMLIIIAIFLLYTSATITAIRSSFLHGTAFAVFCSLERWTFVISIQLIFATLFMRLLRVYRIFFHYQKVGKIWSDKGLLLFIALIVSVSISLLILWTAIDTLRTDETTVFRPSMSRPHFDVYLDCRSNHLGIWLGLILGYTGLIMIAVLALAVMTRKVRIESFRDTKEVNAFVFTTVFLVVVLIALSLLLKGASNVSLYTTFVLEELCYILVPIACKIFLFVPKIYYVHFSDPTRHKSSFQVTGRHTNPRSSLSVSGAVV